MVTLDQIMQRPVVVELSHGDNGDRLSEGFEGANRGRFKNLNLRWCVLDVIHTFRSDGTLLNHPLLPELEQAIKGGYVLDVYGEVFEPGEDALARDYLQEAEDAHGNLFYMLELRVFSDLVAAGMHSEVSQGDGGGNVVPLRGASISSGVIDTLVDAYRRKVGVKPPRAIPPSGGTLTYLFPTESRGESGSGVVDVLQQEQLFFDENARLEQESAEREAEARRQEELRITGELDALERKLRSACSDISMEGIAIGFYLDPFVYSFAPNASSVPTALDTSADKVFAARRIIGTVRADSYAFPSNYRDQAESLRDRCEVASSEVRDFLVKLLYKLVERADAQPSLYSPSFFGPDYPSMVTQMEAIGGVSHLDASGPVNSSDLYGYFKGGMSWDPEKKVCYPFGQPPLEQFELNAPIDPFAVSLDLPYIAPLPAFDFAYVPPEVSSVPTHSSSSLSVGGCLAATAYGAFSSAVGAALPYVLMFGFDTRGFSPRGWKTNSLDELEILGMLGMGATIGLIAGFSLIRRK